MKFDKSNTFYAIFNNIILNINKFLLLLKNEKVLFLIKFIILFKKY